MRLSFLFFLVIGPTILWGQGLKTGPTKVSTAVYFDKAPPLRDLIQLASKYDLVKDKRNEDLKKPRLYPYAATALPKGPDPVWQREQGKRHIANRQLLKVFDGLSNDIDPLDNNGAVGPNHFMQCINLDFAIYEKDGNMVVGPVAMNTLFAGVPGSENNEGDPIVMYDGQADRWFAAEFSGFFSDTSYMLIAVSETNDPTGSWYRWSFVMNGFPDYPKFGITENSYLMGANSWGDNIYAFERNVMLDGGATPQMVQFQATQIPNSGFHVIMPMDIDGPFPPAGTPGYFVTINDDAWDGTSDQLWIYELHVDWANPGDASFQRTQTINVPAFDSDFGGWSDNIVQPGNSQLLDCIPQVLMNRTQLRRFGDTLSLVCVHSVDVDATDHAGLRWYEVTKDINGTSWSVRQTGTYAPDGASRWMGSIAQNGSHEISIGYNVSSTAIYPSIRYCGQSATEYANASGIMDIGETSIFEGSVSQESSSRWGDYTNVSVDPVDDHTFWMANTYNITGYQKGTKIASWNFSPPPLKAIFSANKTLTCPNATVTLTDLSVGNPTAWAWTITPATFSFVGGTGPASQNPQVQFDSTGTYTVSLLTSNTTESDTLVKTAYITITDVAADFAGTPKTLVEGQSVSFSASSDCYPDSWAWSFPGGAPDTFFGYAPPPIIYNSIGTYDVSLTVTRNGSSFTQTKPGYISVIPCKYCPSSFIDSTDDYISRVQVADIDNSSIGNGYEDFTSFVTDVFRDSTYTIQVDVTVNGDWIQYCNVWVDWNHDCQFSDIDEKIDLGQTPGTQGVHSLSGAITVPANALTGQTRMRIIEKWDTPPESCASGFYGETEDYTLNVRDTLVGTTVPDPASDIHLSLFPNPVKEKIHVNITVPRALDGRFFITNTLGQVMQMRQIPLTPGTHAVSLDATLLPAGTYFLSLEHTGHSIRFVKL